MRTRTKEAKTKLAAVRTASHPEVKKTPVIPKTLDLIADAVGEMLTGSTNEYCLDRLLVASLSHITRRGYERGIGTENESEIRAAIDIFVKRHFTEWKSEVMAGWLRKRKQSASAVEPKTITDRIRATVREELAGHFDKFLGDAAPEELRLMNEVLRNRDSYAYGVPTDPSAELPVAQAFGFEVGRDDVYLRIPEHLRAQVEEYVRALIAVEDRAA